MAKELAGAFLETINRANAEPKPHEGKCWCDVRGKLDVEERNMSNKRRMREDK